jgi:hypothetical protein
MTGPRPTLSHQLYLAAPVQRVWQALTDGAITERRFYACRPQGRLVAGSPLAFRQSAQGWPIVLSSMKTLLEAGKPLELPRA